MNAIQLRKPCVIAAGILLATGLLHAQGTSTTRWVEMMAGTYFESRSAGDVRLARFGKTDAMVPLLNGLRASLSDARNEKLGMGDRIAVLTGYRSIWKGDEFQAAAWDIRTARLKQLPDAEVVEWQKALSAANGDQVSDAWTMALISDLPVLFTNEQFDLKKSTAARSQLPNIPPDALQSLADTLKMPRAYAAVLILQNPEFFAGNTFRKPAFDAAVQTLKTKLPAPKA